MHRHIVEFNQDGFIVREFVVGDLSRKNLPVVKRSRELGSSGWGTRWEILPLNGSDNFWIEMPGFGD